MLSISVIPSFEESSNAAHAILRRAEQNSADLIVISTRGRSRAAMTLLGSVASDVMEKANIPVLAVKHFGDSLSMVDLILSGKILSQPDQIKAG